MRGLFKYEKPPRKLTILVVGCRDDYQPKISRTLALDQRVLAIELLNILGMVRNKRLAKQISDAPWG
jgi:putative transposase